MKEFLQNIFAYFDENVEWHFGPTLNAILGFFWGLIAKVIY